MLQVNADTAIHAWKHVLRLPIGIIGCQQYARFMGRFVSWALPSPTVVVTPKPYPGCVRFSEDIMCDVYKYEIDVAAGVVVSHGPATAMEGALAMELPTVRPRRQDP